MIRFLRQDDEKLISQAKELWAEVFHDSVPFIEYYFNERTRPEYILCETIGNEIRGVAHVIPKQLSVRGAMHNARLISGVCTRSEYRGQGIASALLHYAHDNVASDAFILQPANESLFEFYRKLGYRPLCEYDSISIEHRRVYSIEKERTDICTDDIMQVYERVIERCDTYFVLGREDAQALIHEVELGEMFVVWADDTLALCTEEDNVCSVMVLGNELSPKLLNNIFANTNLNLRVVIPMMTEENTHVKFNMIRTGISNEQLGRVVSFLSY